MPAILNKIKYKSARKKIFQTKFVILLNLQFPKWLCVQRCTANSLLTIP